MQDARRGLWWRAADKFKSLIPKADAAPELWRNLSVVRAWLGDNAGSITALRKLAAMDIPWDDAVEAEALAQIYDGGADTDVVDELRATVDVKNPEAANEVFSSHKQFTAFRWESLGIDFGDQPPPRSAYFLLDRPLPATGVGIARQDVPRILARILVFGRQTDREARLEVFCRSTERHQVKQTLATVMPPDALGAWPESPEKVGDVPVAEASLSWSWRLPDDTPPAHIRQMLDDQRRDAVLNIWTQTHQQRFGGKTPAEATSDSQYRVPLAGSVLLIELSFSQASTTSVFDELRTQLGIQPPAVPDMATAGPLGVPYTRLHRLDAPKLSDDDLVMSFQRALQVVARQAVRKLGLEVVGRASLKGKIDMAGVYGHLADLEEASDDAIRYIDLARKAAEEQKQSTAPMGLGRSGAAIAARRTAGVRPLGRAHSIAAHSRTGRGSGADAIAVSGRRDRPRRPSARHARRRRGNSGRDGSRRGHAGLERRRFRRPLDSRRRRCSGGRRRTEVWAVGSGNGLKTAASDARRVARDFRVTRRTTTCRDFSPHITHRSPRPCPTSTLGTWPAL
ncbi:MAG: hypothetical protein QM775_00905 [Pirellulales bacterium]